MEVTQVIVKVAPITYVAGGLAYEASNVGSSTIVKLFATLTGQVNNGRRKAVLLNNTHATQSIYVSWVPRGHATMVGGSDLTAAKCKQVVPALNSVQLQFGPDIDVFILGSGATTTYTAEEVA